MTLHAIVRALGGNLHAGGRRANVPAPGHGPQDRSVSLLLSGGRVVVCSFGAADWREVLDDLRARGLIDGRNRPCGGGDDTAGPIAALAEPTRGERVAAAAALWSSGVPLAPDNPAGRHCRLRGVAPPFAPPTALRAHAAVPGAVYRGRGPRRPAMLAAVRAADGAPTAVEITYLTEDGRRRRMATPRKVAGVLPRGGAVRLAEAGPELVVAEGVFTALSAMKLFGLPGWALLSANRLSCWTPPAGVRRVVVAADRDAAGLAAATRLQASLQEMGVRAEVRPPPAPFGDWNDAWLGGGVGPACTGPALAGERQGSARRAAFLGRDGAPGSGGA